MGIGAVLSQREHLVAYLSKAMGVITDYHSLNYCTQQKNHIVVQQKWILKLVGYDFHIFYRKGANNLEADGLSRRRSRLEELHRNC
ncbi:hypothetical protein EJ110_NYTH55734 [Nymphaea thermarum]|nr:hypothetical protein EJ110_NYTH55734 [Nymphaea thermarum]